MSSTDASHTHPGNDRAPSAPPPDPLVGRVVDGRYRVEAVLGEGGMGLVYRATHVVLNKPLAVKVLKSDVSRDAEVLERFKQEAQSASGIGNQHIIDISDFGVLPDGSTYFVMEFLDGVSLTRAIEEQNPMPPARAVHIVKQLCDALGAAHARNIVHRDMKPDNVYLIRRGQETDFVKVLDFGIAKVGGTASKLTKAGQVFGTPHYMSPEQCSGTGVDPRTDVYATGVMLYEMLSGRVPFDADNLMGILTKHMYEPPPALRSLPSAAAVSPELEAVVMRCLEKKADVRYASMDELRAELDRLTQGLLPLTVSAAHAGGTAGPTTRGQVPSMMNLGGEASAPASRGGRGGLVAGLALTGLLTLGGGGYALWSLAATPPPTEMPARPTAPPAPPPPTPPVAAPPTAGGAAPIADPGAGVAAPNGPAASATVEVRLVSEPAAAAVYRDGAMVGNAPYVLSMPAGGEGTDIVLRLPGYDDLPVRVSPDVTTPELLLRMVPTAVEPTRGGSRGGSRRSSPGGSGTSTNSPPTSPGGHGGHRAPAPGEVIDPWG